MLLLFNELFVLKLDILIGCAYGLKHMAQPSAAFHSTQHQQAKRKSDAICM